MSKPDRETEAPMTDVPTFVAHFAIPTHDLDTAAEFFPRVLGARQARRYHDRVTFEFFTHQIVCHLAPDQIVAEPTFYPRHFGVTFREQADYDALVARIEAEGQEWFMAPTVRFADLPERHKCCAILDPSNNVIEFKWYAESVYAY